MINEIKEYNQRQLMLMIAKINFYKKNEISFGHLLVSLEALCSCLKNTEISWKENFYRLCNNLDYSYLNFNNINLSKEIRISEKIEFDESINELIKLIHQKIPKSNLESH